MKKITLLLFLMVCSFGFAQSVGPVTAASLSSQNQNTAVNQNTNYSSSMAIDYTLDQSGAFNPIDISGTGIDVPLGDDDGTGPISMGFTFTFIGNDYTDIYISSNGYLTFDPADVTDLSDDAIPDATLPNNIIAVAWDDLDPGNGGQPAMNVVRYSTEGTAPNRVFVVEYFNVDQWPSGNNITTQAQLYEGSNIIEIHTTTKPDDGGGSTQGIENFDGSDGLAVPGRNAQTWSITNDYVAFIPNTAAPGDWTVTVEDTVNFGDEVTWELRDNGGVVLLSGGPYGGPPYSDTQMVTTANEPLEFYIESFGTFGDNTPNYTISCGGNVIVSGQLAGNTDTTESGLVCGGGGGATCGTTVPNYTNAAPAGNGTPSQNFPNPGNDPFDSEAADDFVIPLAPSMAAAICEVSITGTSTLGGLPADPNSLVTLNIYSNAGGIPGSIIYTEDFLGPAVDPANTGSFVLSPTGAVNLVGGETYWLSVVATLDFALAGQWFWSTASDGNDGPYQWQNPGGGFGTPCTTWGDGGATCGVGGGTGPDLLMDISFVEVPTSDQCAGALPVACGDVVVGTTADNTDQGGETAAPDEWYSFTGSGTQEFVTLSFCDGGTTYDSRVAVYDSCGGTLVIDNDDFCGLQSQVTFLSDGTTTYVIAVEGFGTSSGAFSMEVTCEPIAVNDECANATTIACGETLLGTTRTAFFDPLAPVCTTPITAPGVWYTFEDTSGLVTDYTVSLCDGGTAYDSKITVYSGDCGTLTCVGDNDDSCGLQSEVSWQGDGSTTYYILVHGFGSAQGDFSINLACTPVPPPNDMIVNSIDVDEIGFPYTDPAVAMPAATTENGNPTGCAIDGANGVWYNFVAAGNGTATASIVSPAGASFIVFYKAPDENAIETDLEYFYQIGNQCAPGTTANINTEAGQAYYLFVVNTGGITDIVIDGTNLGTADNTIEGFSYYPNPASEVLNLNSIDMIDTVSIYNILGQEVIGMDVNATTGTVNVSSLTTGTYIMKVSVNGEIGTYKILKE
jgi:hypothetical protein